MLGGRILSVFHWIFRLTCKWSSFLSSNLSMSRNSYTPKKYSSGCSRQKPVPIKGANSFNENLKGNNRKLNSDHNTNLKLGGNSSKVQRSSGSHTVILPDFSPFKQREALQSSPSHILGAVEGRDASRPQEQGRARGPRSRSHSVGLRNVGNSCYINSILQCLVRIREIRTAEFQRENSSLLKIFGELLKSMTSAVDRTTISPLDMHECIRKTSQKFANYVQQDAHSFLLFLLREIELGANFSGVNCKELFASTQEMSITYDCGLGHHKSSSQSVYAFVLPVIADKDVEEIINDIYFEKNERKEEELLCSKCQKVTPGTIKEKITRLPQYLTVLLNRFKFENGSKEASMTLIPKLIKLRLHAGSYNGFALFAVCNHHGRSVTSGHYTADVVDFDCEHWFHFDDSRVSEIESHESTLRSAEAYMLFYERKDERKESEV